MSSQQNQDLSTLASPRRCRRRRLVSRHTPEFSFSLMLLLMMFMLTMAANPSSATASATGIQSINKEDEGGKTTGVVGWKNVLKRRELDEGEGKEREGEKGKERPGDAASLLGNFPTSQPVLMPTPAPSPRFLQFIVPVTMLLFDTPGMLVGGNALEFEYVTERHIVDEVMSMEPTISTLVYDLIIQVNIARQQMALDVPSRRRDRRRDLADGVVDPSSLTPLRLQADVQVRYRSMMAGEQYSVDPSMWIKQAFNSPRERADYASRLQETDADNFRHVVAVDVLVDGDMFCFTNNNGNDQNTDVSASSMYPSSEPDCACRWIVISASIGAFLAISIIGLLVLRQSYHRKFKHVGPVEV